MKIINKEKFFLEDVTKLEDSSYGEPWSHQTYRSFLAFFESKPELTADDLIIGANFTYAWMPTMNRMRGNAKGVLSAINRIRGNRTELSGDEIIQLRLLTNNSLVGASKLLHFIEPNKYAIWDSRVYRYLFPDRKPYSNKLNKFESYLDYLSDVRMLSQDERTGSLCRQIEEKIGYEVSPIRACELVMFELGEPPKTTKRRRSI